MLVPVVKPSDPKNPFSGHELEGIRFERAGNVATVSGKSTLTGELVYVRASEVVILKKFDTTGAKRSDFVLVGAR